jgi:tRNA threonylcarbamoyl adenosine modification protein YeaZ
VSGTVTLALTTARSVAAALITDMERARSTTDQALSGGLACVRALLDEADVALGSVQLIAVCTGPGSFTGLRIGVALAKSLAQASSLPIIGVSSYDIAEFGDNVGAFPSAAVVEGKRDFYYARIRDSATSAPRFVRGTGADLADATAGHLVHALADVPAAEQALRAARIAMRLAGQGVACDWRTLDIDYGQRPNAVINWEARRGPAERGGAPSASNVKPQ